MGVAQLTNKTSDRPYGLSNSPGPQLPKPGFAAGDEDTVQRRVPFHDVGGCLLHEPRDMGIRIVRPEGIQCGEGMGHISDGARLDDEDLHEVGRSIASRGSRSMRRSFVYTCRGGAVNWRRQALHPQVELTDLLAGHDS